MVQEQVAAQAVGRHEDGRLGTGVDAGGAGLVRARRGPGHGDAAGVDADAVGQAGRERLRGEEGDEGFGVLNLVQSCARVAEAVVWGDEYIALFLAWAYSIMLDDVLYRTNEKQSYVVTIEPVREIIPARAGRHATSVPVYNNGAWTPSAGRKVVVELDIVVTNGVINQCLDSLGKLV